MNTTDGHHSIIFDISIEDDIFKNSTIISNEIVKAEQELLKIDNTIEFEKESYPRCDKIDYALAVCSGILCGLIDIFFVGIPGEKSVLGEFSDQWILDCVKKFAKLKGWNPNGKKTAIGYLEDIYKIPYDQRGCGDAGKDIFELTPSNHHFKSLGHQPSLIGLIFSIIDQFTNQSHFVSNGQLIVLEEADGKFILRGHSFVEKLFCGFTNWFCHLVSDVSGSSSSTTRGMGIPSPLWSWVNSIIVLKAKMGIPDIEFRKRLCDIAVKVYMHGFDFRFTIAQSIPVILNELIVRLFYFVRRYLNTYKDNDKEKYWDICKLYKNPNLIRMLTIAHGTFCTLDIGDATIQAFIKGGGNFNTVDFLLRINVVGIGRFSLALYSEFKMSLDIRDVKQRTELAQKERRIIEDYIRGLKELSGYYNDNNFISFVKIIAENKDIKLVFEKSVDLAKDRGISTPLKTKDDIDNYFMKKYGKERNRIADI